jgi:predicted nucleotidyltransferase
LSRSVIEHFRAVVAKTYGDRLERVILYGSRARGDAQPDSDYDIAVFLHDVNDLNTRWTEMDRLADISTTLLEEIGEFIHAMAYRAGSYNERTPLMHEIRREGIDL